MSLTSLKNKLENLVGEYTFDFTKEDDWAFMLEQFGGEERIRKNFPEVYESLLFTREQASINMCSDEEQQEIDIDATLTDLCLKTESELNGTDEAEKTADGDEFGVLAVDLMCSFVDPTKEVNTSDPADEWKGITVQVKIKETNSPVYLYRHSFSVPAANSYNSMITTPLGKLSELDNKAYDISVTVTGKDPNNIYHAKTIQKPTKKIGTVENYPIYNVDVDDPAPKSTAHSNKIIMLYGRTNEQQIYKDADYKDGDYLNNTFNNGKVHLLMPLAGKIILDYKVEPTGLVYEEEEVLVRPTATYDYKKQTFKYRNDIRNDKELYDKIKGNFKADTYNPGLRTNVSFDFSLKDDNNRSKYDWRCDVEGVQNGEPKTIMLQGAFTYGYKDQLGAPVDSQIIIKSVTEDDLKGLHQEYYKFDPKSCVVCIPPITVYWGCFGKDVKIRLADQTEKKASEIKVKDQLIGYGDQVLTVNDIVTGADHTIFNIKTRKNGDIQVSGGHPMMCGGESKRAAQLKTGDKLNLADGSLAEIESIEVVPYDDTVYNFTFDGCEDGAYLIANGFYSGDLNMQNKKQEVIRKELTEKDQAFIEEMRRFTEEMNAVD